jgi:hypothetical protein
MVLLSMLHSGHHHSCDLSVENREDNGPVLVNPMEGIRFSPFGVSVSGCVVDLARRHICLEGIAYPQEFEHAQVVDAELL